MGENPARTLKLHVPTAAPAAASGKLVDRPKSLRGLRVGLLDNGKEFSDIVLDDMAEYQSEYVRNTAIVSTLLTDHQGGKVRITDFVPRFRQYGRVFRRMRACLP